jgi:hypothetical protein
MPGNPVAAEAVAGRENAVREDPMIIARSISNIS